MQGSLRTEEVVRPHFESIAVSQLDISLIPGVDTVTALSSLQIHVGHLCILSDSLPEHLSLIVAQVYAMHMFACVFAHQVWVVVAVLVVYDRSGSQYRCLLGRFLVRLRLLFVLHHLVGLLSCAAFILFCSLAESVACCHQSNAKGQKYSEFLHYFHNFGVQKY